jgi:hypothetical protein
LRLRAANRSFAATVADQSGRGLKDIPRENMLYPLEDIHMPLYIKDPDVDRLVERFMASSGAKTKTDAVRNALLESIATLEN